MANLEDLILRDTRANQPAASIPGRLYYVTDEEVTERDNGSSWDDVTDAASGGYSEGTSFPGSPSTNDKYYRTDRNLLYYYDGTRWLTTQLFYISPTNGVVGVIPYSASGTHGKGSTDPTYDMYLVAYEFTTLVVTTNSGSAYWTCTLSWENSADSTISSSSGDTSADSADTWVRHSVSIGAVMSNTARILSFLHAKTGSPGNLYMTDRLSYRLVG